MAMQVLVELGKAFEGATASEDYLPYPKEALQLIFEKIFSVEGAEPAEALDELLHKTLASFGDIRFHAYLMFPEILKGYSGRAQFEGVAGRMVRHLGSLDVDTKFRRTLVPLPESVTKRHPVKARSGHHGEFNACWLAILRIVPEDCIAVHKRILAVLDDSVIPFMTRPQLLIDYLTAAYDAGGIVSLLALSSLFTLIRKHNLDYPAFYPKLYSLLDQRILHISYRRRFLRLLDMFMQSTMITVGLVAAFAKKVSRLALYAPAASLQWVVPFVYNLLKRHPACRVMIHREGIDSLAADPWLEDEPNPEASRALESSLWELQTLTRHAWGPVARQAGIFSDRFTKPPMDLEKFLGHSPFTYEEIVEAELSHRWSKRPPTQLDVPSSAFDC